MGETQLVLGGVETRVLDEGSGLTVVLVHATPFDLEYWSGLATDLSVDHRVIRYDLPGHGAARAASVPSTDRLALDLLDALDALEVPSAHIVGHSLGAVIALRFALDHPGRARRVSLLGARASPSPVFGALARALRHDVAVAAMSINRWFPAAQVAANDAAVRYARASIDNTTVTAWADALDRLAEVDVLAQLPELTMPVDILVGEEDHGAKPEHSRAIAAAIPGSRCHVVPGARPLLALEHPHVVAQLLR